jgi:hypothetical protein
MGPREIILESIAEHKLEFEEPIKNTIIVCYPIKNDCHLFFTHENIGGLPFFFIYICGV